MLHTTSEGDPVSGGTSDVGGWSDFGGGTLAGVPGTSPADQVHPLTVQVMAEAGVDISRQWPKSVDQFVSQPFDYVITVCGDARDTCPVFTGEVKHRLHMGFEDPALVSGSEEDVLAIFRRVRDEISERFGELIEEVNRKT